MYIEKYTLKKYTLIKIYIEKTKICNWPHFRNYEGLDQGLLAKFDPNTLIYRLVQ